MSDTTNVKSMAEIVALCRRRGFIFQSSEIYGGINGFWDYGPLGVELKRNLKEAWWQDIVRCPPDGPDGKPISVVSVDCTIIMHPKVWEASGHVAGFNDPMVDDKETKERARADHLFGLFTKPKTDDKTVAEIADEIRHEVSNWSGDPFGGPTMTCVAANADEASGVNMARLDELKRKTKRWEIIARHDGLGHVVEYWTKCSSGEYTMVGVVLLVPRKMLEEEPGIVPSPFPGKAPPDKRYERKGVLTPPRQFNLMFEVYVGAVRDEENKSYLRPETAQGIFTQFWNVIDTQRVKVPFGIAQMGKAFRNEVTPRNFTFRSREFEQMEIEFFIQPEQVCNKGDATPRDWYQYWRQQRCDWWKSVGLASDNLQLREHDKDELAHYAKEGVGTSDVEYRFPFTAPGFGELEGIAHRTDFDLRQHATHCGKADKMRYFDQERNQRYFPHVIEPSAGADRGTLALLCEAYTPDESRPSKVYMKLEPRMAPIKAGIFPLVNKDGMPEVAEALYRELRVSYSVQFDVKQSIGKRYARMDEAGTPFCFTIDSQTLQDQTITVRYRDTQQQERIGKDRVAAFLAEKIGGSDGSGT